MNKLQELRFHFMNAVTEYVQEFCEKHGWKYDASGWVAGDVGGVIEIEDMYISFDDIRADIDHEFDKDAFVEWYKYDQRVTELGCTQHINYRSFAFGAPRPYSDEVLAKIEDCKAEIDQLINGKFA